MFAPRQRGGRYRRAGEAKWKCHPRPPQKKIPEIQKKEGERSRSVTRCKGIFIETPFLYQQLLVAEESHSSAHQKKKKGSARQRREKGFINTFRRLSRSLVSRLSFSSDNHSFSRGCGMRGVREKKLLFVPFLLLDLRLRAITATSSQ